MSSLHSKVVFALFQTINASSVYIIASFVFIIASCIYKNKACNQGRRIIFCLSISQLLSIF
ncbi:hypothetical protein E5353_13730, partial [Bacteroides caecimuris]